jgi:ketosteroid isomerase-like protein
MQPFEIFRTEVEEFVDVDDDRVLVLIRDHTRPRGTDAEIESLGCNLWTLRDGRITRIDFYPTRSQGLEVAGLRE